MGSLIVDIYNAIAGVGINIEGTPIVGRVLADTSTVVNSTPLRIISPLSDKNEGRKAIKMTFGNQTQVDWTITDLLLYNKTTDGSGIENDMYWLVKYQGAYVDAMRAMYKLGYKQHVQIVSIDIEIGVFRFPINGDKFYHGAKATLVVHEIIP